MIARNRSATEYRYGTVRTLFSVAVIAGFLTGVREAAAHFLPNRYVHHGMFRLVMLDLQKPLNTWVMASVGVAVLVTVVGLPLVRRRKSPSPERPLRFTAFFRVLHTTAILSLVLLVVLNLGVFLDGVFRAPEGPNVIILGIDTLRADHLSPYGYHRDTAPALSRLAEQSLVFSRTYSTSSWTLPSFHSILTSLYQVSHGVADENFTLPDSIITLAELMKEHGYTTAGFISGPLMKRLYGFDQGFDTYEESVSAASNILSHGDITSPRLKELVLGWLREHRDEKFFLFVHWWDPHSDYIPPYPYNQVFDPEYTGALDGTQVWISDRINPDMDERDLQHLIALYDGEILWTDKHLAEILEYLDEAGIMDDTIVVIVGDHGEEFFEHGDKGHRVTLYNEVIHVPLIMKVPGLEEGRTVETTVSVVDIMPTLLDLLDIHNPAEMEGISLIPLIDNDNGRLHDAVYSQLSSDIVAIIAGDWKYIDNIWDGTSELYNMGTDFSERHNLVETHRELADSLHEKTWNWVTTKLKEKQSTPEAQIDEETRKQLESLGYIQ